MPEPSERTPLLEDGPRESSALPSLRAALRTLAAHQQQLTSEHITDLLSSFPSLPPSRQYAFFFAVVLYLEARVMADRTSTLTQVNGVARTTHALCTELWASYVEVALAEVGDDDHATERAIMEMLWMPVRVDDDGENDDAEGRTSVAELLDILHKTNVLLEQPLVSMAIEAAWKYGHPWPRPAPTPRAESLLGALFRRLSRPVSPRVSHLLDAIVYTTYIACEAHVVITGLRDRFGRQDMWILIYSTYALLPFPLPPRPRPSLRRKKYFVPRRVGFILALLAYLTPPRLWERPKPETLPHVWLLLSVGWNTMRLILSPAMRPGWILLLPPRVSLVPALEFNRFLRPVVIRPIIYFIPLILLYGLMLSLSMDDPWKLQSQSQSLSSSFFAVASSVKAKTFPILQPIIPAPYDTREAFFLFLLLTVSFWFFFALASLIRVAASLNLQQAPSPPTSVGSPNPNPNRAPRSPSFVVSPLHTRMPTSVSVFSLSSPAPAPISAAPDTSEDEDRGPLRSDAVRILLHSVMLYQGYHFPAPVSVLPFLLVSLPSYVLAGISALVGRIGEDSDSDGATQSQSPARSQSPIRRSVRAAQKAVLSLDGVLWWVIIWPPSMVLAGLWGWGFRAPAHVRERERVSRVGSGGA